MAAGKNLDQTSSLYVSIVIVGFVLISKLIEHFFDHAIHYLHRIKHPALVAVVEHVKDEIMLVGTLSMFLIFVENSLATWCVDRNDVYVPALNHEACVEYYSGRRSSLGNTTNTSRRLSLGSTRALLGSSSSGTKQVCPDGQTFFVEVKALHQAHFLIFYLSLTHIVYSLVSLYIARWWSNQYARWEASVLSNYGGIVTSVQYKLRRRPKNIWLEYLNAFKEQFYFQIDHTTAAVLRQYYIVVLGLPEDYRYFGKFRRDMEVGFAEICGLDTTLWVYTAATMWTEGMPNSSKGGDLPVGTIFGCVLAFGFATKMLIWIQRLVEAVFLAMEDHNFRKHVIDVNHLPKSDYTQINMDAMTDPVDGEEEEEVGLTKPANTIFDGIQINFGSWPFKQHGSTIMLWGIKLVLFQFSQKICFTIFYFQQFRDANGTWGSGCYILSRTPASLIVSNIVNVVMVFHIGMVLIPLYCFTKHVDMHRGKEEGFIPEASRFIAKSIKTVAQQAKNVRQKKVKKQKSTRTSHGVKKSKYKLPFSFKKEKPTSSALAATADNDYNRRESIDIYGPDPELPKNKEK